MPTGKFKIIRLLPHPFTFVCFGCLFKRRVSFINCFSVNLIYSQNNIKIYDFVALLLALNFIYATVAGLR